MEEKKFGLKALGRVVVIKKPEIQEETKSGIYKGDTIIKEEKKKLNNEFLEVLAVGELVETIKVGDKVLVTGTITGVIVDGIECGYVYEAGVVGIKV